MRKRCQNLIASHGLTMSDEKLTVAVLGPLGTYTHEAAFKEFGHGASYEEQNSITDVFDALSPQIPFGVVPQENSIFGAVIETYDALREPHRTFIRGEITLKVEHCLLVRKGVKLGEIKRIMSHEQALGQCRDFIARNLPTAYTVKTPSTAAAAKALLRSPPDCAAICSTICATLLEGLEILLTNIQNEQSNFTRFLVIAHSQHTSIPSVLRDKFQTKGLIVLSTLNRSSSEMDTSVSLDIMKYLKLLDLFVTRIDRRPSPSVVPFGSIYFVEVQRCSNRGRHSDEKVLEGWTEDVEDSVSRVNSSGGKANVIGIW
ncbi:Prephenate dehydratase-domain-containing protein [Gymnopilus junonius]|uniref:prephenate dehydratase n=1 Tax=Gymnopilus junonius TaxID=109634 RepID=A0A9P5P1M1_GYMJU|nr:Prephenate dehydratase-domain-containing protein [Gymnopilus junonius]